MINVHRLNVYAFERFHNIIITGLVTLNPFNSIGDLSSEFDGKQDFYLRTCTRHTTYSNLVIFVKGLKDESYNIDILCNMYSNEVEKSQSVVLNYNVFDSLILFEKSIKYNYILYLSEMMRYKIKRMLSYHNNILS